MTKTRMPRHSLTDAQWELIADLFPVGNFKTGRRPRDRRVILNAILWVLRTGARWRDVPTEYGPWSTAWNFFDAWTKDGTFDAMLQRLRGLAMCHEGSADELWCVDGTSVRAARCSGGGGKNQDPQEPEDHALGRSRGGFGTKIHVLCNADGQPLHFELSAGQVHDSAMLDELVVGADKALVDGDNVPMAWPLKLAGDKGYRAAWIDAYVLSLEITPVIPSKANEDRDARPVAFDKAAYRRRSIVERLIGWLKESRRIMTRFEKTAMNFGGMVKLAFIDRYLRLCAP